MTARKISISMDDELEARVREAAAREGLSFSAYIARAADHRAKLDAGLAAMAEYEAEHGAFTPEEMAEAYRTLGWLVPEDIARTA